MGAMGTRGEWLRGPLSTDKKKTIQHIRKEASVRRRWGRAMVVRKKNLLAHNATLLIHDTDTGLVHGRGGAVGNTENSGSSEPHCR